MGPGVAHRIRRLDLLNAAGDLGFCAGVIAVSRPSTPATALRHRTGYCECEYQKYCLDLHNISFPENSYVPRVRITQKPWLVRFGLVGRTTSQPPSWRRRGDWISLHSHPVIPACERWPSRGTYVGIPTEID